MRQPPTKFTMQRLPNQFSSLAFAFYMSFIIAFIMSLVLTMVNSGVDSSFLLRALKAYTVAMPVAFVCVIVVRPIVVRLVLLTVEADAR